MLLSLRNEAIVSIYADVNWLLSIVIRFPSMQTASQRSTVPLRLGCLQRGQCRDKGFLVYILRGVMQFLRVHSALFAFLKVTL
jgi:hypothetical protein